MVYEDLLMEDPTFSAFGTGLITGTRTHFDLAKSNPAYMYAAVYSSSVTLYKSTDFGLNWSALTTTTAFQNQCGQAWYDLYLRVNPSNHLKVYVGTDRCISFYGWNKLYKYYKRLCWR